jgi:hypothetical protein
MLRQSLAEAASEWMEIGFHQREECAAGFFGKRRQLLRVAEAGALEGQGSGLVEDDLFDTQGSFPDAMVAQVDAGAPERADGELGREREGQADGAGTGDNQDRDGRLECERPVAGQPTAEAEG